MDPQSLGANGLETVVFGSRHLAGYLVGALEFSGCPMAKLRDSCVLRSTIGAVCPEENTHVGICPWT